MKKKYIVLGVNFGGHDTSAALGINGEIVAACEQERYDKKKHSREFPIDAIKDCLKIANIKISDVDEIALNNNFYEMIKNIYLIPAINDKKRLRFLFEDIERIKSYDKQEETVRDKLNFKKKISQHRHHYCHLISAYKPSGFKKSLIMSNDGIGENESGMIGKGINGKISVIDSGPMYPDSLGLIYSAITFYLGWRHHCDEGIIMGLAPYGNAYDKITKNKTYIDIFRDIIRYDNKNKRFSINKHWISYHLQRDTWISKKFIQIFGKKREKNGKINQNHKNIAAALQLRLEEVVLSILKYYQKKFKLNNLSIAGGVGLNCSLNGKILASNIFKRIYIQPASGDAGTAIGAVYSAFENYYKKPYQVKKRTNTYLGSSSSSVEIKKYLIKNKIKFKEPRDIYEILANEINNKKIVAIYQDRAEFGPRALGNRSIICKPFPKNMKDYLNLRVKFRENFRPFAPAVISEDKDEYFNIKQESPHMLIACKANKKNSDLIPAVIHVDNTCRVQTVDKKINPSFYKLLQSFKKLTGCSVLLNTSFNVKGQPIVNSIEEAVNTFKKTNIDILFIGKFLIFKDDY